MKDKIYISVLFVIFLWLQGCDNVEIINTTETNTTESNQAPSANAGSDKTIALFEGIEIIGSGTDVDGTIVDYEWKEDTTLISGLKEFTYLGTIEGNHTLTLTVVDDDGLMGSDTMNIVVTAEINTTI